MFSTPHHRQGKVEAAKLMEVEKKTPKEDVGVGRGHLVAKRHVKICQVKSILVFFLSLFFVPQFPWLWDLIWAIWARHWLAMNIDWLWTLRGNTCHCIVSRVPVLPTEFKSAGMYDDIWNLCARVCATYQHHWRLPPCIHIYIYIYIYLIYIYIFIYKHSPVYTNAIFRVYASVHWTWHIVKRGRTSRHQQIKRIYVLYIIIFDMPDSMFFLGCFSKDPQWMSQPQGWELGMYPEKSDANCWSNMTHPQWIWPVT